MANSGDIVAETAVTAAGLMTARLVTTAVDVPIMVRTKVIMWVVIVWMVVTVVGIVMG